MKTMQETKSNDLIQGENANISNATPEPQNVLEQLEEEEDDSDDDEEEDLGESSSRHQKTPLPRRKKNELCYIQDRVRRHITFSKRKNGLMKKAFELALLTQSEVLLVLASQNSHVYTFATKKFNPIVESSQGKDMIQSFLEDPDSPANYPSRESLEKELGRDPSSNLITPLKRKAQTNPVGLIVCNPKVFRIYLLHLRKPLLGI
jgi:hypothetical protein